MNNKTITEFGFRVMWRIMQILEDAIHVGASASVDNRELKNHDEVHNDDVSWPGKDWKDNVSFGGKKET